MAQLETLVERVGRLEGRYGADRGAEVEASGSMSSLCLPVSNQSSAGAEEASNSMSSLGLPVSSWGGD